MHVSPPTRLTIAIVAFACALRIAWGILVPVVPVSDSAAYDTFSRNIAQAGVYGWTPEESSAYWAPGTSFVYGASYYLFGVRYAPIVALHVLIGGLIVWQMIALGTHLLGPRTGIIAGMLTATWPIYIQYTTILASEMLFIAATLGGILCWLRLGTKPSLRIIGTGVLFAAAAYIRPTALLVPVMLAGVEFLRSPQRARVFVQAALVGVVMVAVIAPWSIRSTRVCGGFVAISTNGGTNFWMGNNPETTGAYQPLPDWTEGMAELEREQALKQIARTYIREDPGAFVTRTLVKFVRLHDRQTIGIAWNIEGLRRVTSEGAIAAMKVIGQVYWLGVLGMGVIGGALLLARRRLWAWLTNPAVYLWAYFAGVHAVIVIQDRYLLPATPFIGLLAAFAMVTIWDRWRGGASEPGQGAGRPATPTSPRPALAAAAEA